jgi:hypothetical protein
MRQAEEPGTFDIKTDQAYYFHAGFRQYPRLATAALPNTKAGDSLDMMFQFDGATSTLLGFSAVATTILASLF